MLADFSSYFSPTDFSCRTEVSVAFLAGGRGPFSAFRDHAHSLPCAPLHLQSQQGRISLVPNPLQASNLPLPLTSVPRFKGNHADNLPFLKSSVPYKITQAIIFTVPRTKPGPGNRGGHLRFYVPSQFIQGCCEQTSSHAA